MKQPLYHTKCKLRKAPDNTRYGSGRLFSVVVNNCFFFPFRHDLDSRYVLGYQIRPICLSI